jgi:hypothetical protein
MSCTAVGEGLVAGLAWAGGAAEEAEAEEGIVEVEAWSEVGVQLVYKSPLPFM